MDPIIVTGYLRFYQRLKCIVKITISKICHIYTPKLETFHKETLSVLNLNKIGFINSEIYRHIEADELVTVDHPYYFSGTILEQNQFLPEWVLDWIRNTYIKFAKECEISDKVFIDRKY